MSTSYFAHCVYGVSSEINPELHRILMGKIEGADWEDREKTLDSMLIQYEVALAKVGIIVPDGFRLWWTGDECDRPGRCETPPGEVILGIAMLAIDDWEVLARMSAGFRQEASLHTWVTYG